MSQDVDNNTSTAVMGRGVWAECIITVMLIGLKFAPDQVASDPDVRLYDQERNSYGGMQGFIQVHDERNNTWSFVNTSDWNYSDAMVACREMGYEGVAEITSGTADVSVNTTRERRGVGTVLATVLPTVISSGLQCIGSEQSLGDCLKDVAINSVTTFLPNVFTTARRTGKVSYKGVGKVSCTNFKTIKLSGGYGDNEGRVEVFYNNSWGTVCDDDWELRDANVVCREMGYPEALTATRQFGGGKATQIIWIDDTHCRGNETSVFLCKKASWGKTNCNHWEDVGVICKAPQGIGAGAGAVENSSSSLASSSQDDGSNQGGSSSGHGIPVAGAAVLSVLAGLLVVVVVIILIAAIVLHYTHRKSPQTAQASTAIPEISVPLMEKQSPEADNGL